MWSNQVFNIGTFIEAALAEDVGDGDHSSLACVSHDAVNSARLLVKQPGIIAGVELAEQIMRHLCPVNVRS